MAETVVDESIVQEGSAAADPARGPEAAALHASARRVALVLAAASIAAFAAGIGILQSPGQLTRMTGVALVGFAGSGVGAFTSLLARYANGLELADGAHVPSAAEGELYHRRLAFCFLMRPVLGALVAPLIVGGVTLFVTRHEDFTNSFNAMMIASFVGGLYAKSALETAKNAFKVVFRA
jgi:ATP-dependent protease HslVU (ClpYQ) peptidase subunit